MIKLRTLLIVSGIVLLMLIPITIFFPVVGLSICSLHFIALSSVLVYRHISEVGEYEFAIDDFIDDTQKVITELEKLTNNDILRDAPEIRALIQFLRAYQQQLINNVNSIKVEQDERARSQRDAEFTDSE